MKRANCRRAATAGLLAECERLRNRLVPMSLDGDNGDVIARQRFAPARGTRCNRAAELLTEIGHCEIHTVVER